MSLFSHCEKCLRKPSRRQVWITYCREWTISGWNYLGCATTWYDLLFSSVRDLEMSDCCIKCAWTVEFYKIVSRNVEILSDKMGFYSKKQSGPPPQSSTLKGIEFDLKVTWQTQGCGTLTALCVWEHTWFHVHTVCSAVTREHTARTFWASPLRLLWLVQDLHCRDPRQGFPLLFLQKGKK